MGGTKATALAEHCRARGHSFLRFDYFGHGASSGDFRAGSIGRWAEDSQILVGSSMGSWIALLAALARPDRIRGLIGIASAPDFTEDLIWNRFSEEQGRRFRTSGELSAPSVYESELIPITYRLVEEGRQRSHRMDAARHHAEDDGKLDIAEPAAPWAHGMSGEQRQCEQACSCDRRPHDRSAEPDGGEPEDEEARYEVTLIRFHGVGSSP